MKQKHKIMLFVFITILFFSKIFAGGGVYWQENGVLVCDSTFGGGLYPMGITSDGYGGAIIVWEDGRTLSGIACQRIDSLGNIMWDSDGVFIDSSASIIPYPSIVSDGSGGAIISWVHDEMSIGKVYVQRVRNDGIPLWGYPGISAAFSDSLQRYPSIVSDGAGGCIVAWLDRRNGGTDIYAQRVDSSGVRLWGVGGVEVSSEPGISGWFPSISSDGGKGVIIAWSDKRYGNYDVFAQRIDSAGILQWGVNGIEVYVGDSTQNSPIIGGTNKKIVGWTDWRNGNRDIYSQSFDLDGNILWSTTGVPICVFNEFQGIAAIKGDAKNGAIFVWWDYRNGNLDIFSQRVDSAGNLLWDSIGVAVCDADSDQEYLSVVSDSRSGAIVTWKDYRNSNWDIYCQRIDSLGILQWGVDGLPVCITADGQDWGPAICEDSKNGGIIAWGDRRYYASVYAQRVGDVEGVEERKNSDFEIRNSELKVYPNPFTTSTTISFTLPNAEGIGQSAKNTELKIYDLSGRLVKDFSLGIGHLSLTTVVFTAVSWDGKGDDGKEVSGGIYFVKLKVKSEKLKVEETRKIIKLK